MGRVWQQDAGLVKKKGGVAVILNGTTAESIQRVRAGTHDV